MSERRWYEDGLRFECIGCGDCCRNHGEYCYVYLAPADVDAISLCLGLHRHEFIERFCVREDGYISLENSGPSCVFLEGAARCRVYHVRPKQCSTWPFWTENLTQEVWYGAVSTCCPGVGRGRLHSADEIDRIASERDAWYDVTERDLFGGE